jgi:hypothetical protein
MKNVCFYCECQVSNQLFAVGTDSMKTIDHVIPTSRGGNNNSFNKVICCYYCNHLKGNLTPVEFLSKCLSSKNGRKNPEGRKLMAKNAQILANRVVHHLEIMTKKGKIVDAGTTIEARPKPKAKRVPKNPQNEWVRTIEDKIRNANNKGYKPLDESSEDIVTRMLNAPQETFHY